MKRTTVFIFIAALLIQVSGCVTHTYSKPQPIPGVGGNLGWGWNALRLTLPDIELIVQENHGDSPNRWGRWPVDDKKGSVLMLVIVDPMGNSVQFDPFRVRYRAFPQSAVTPSVVQGPPARYNTDLGRFFETCHAKPGSYSHYRDITEPTRVYGRTCFRLFFEVKVSPPTETTLMIEGISTAGKPIPVPLIKFKVRKQKDVYLP